MNNYETKQVLKTAIREYQMASNIAVRAFHRFPILYKFVGMPRTIAFVPIL